MTNTSLPPSGQRHVSGTMKAFPKDEQARDYIIFMLGELCELAQKNKHDDIWPFLNLSYLAISKREKKRKSPRS
ncbi:MAG: hypothetical protein JKX72_10185 [Robiginitomaculum sp.]|nr:hypothetical protein [Robiginitomaculum sp.]